MKGKQKRDEEKQRVQVEETRITGMLNFVVFLAMAAVAYTDWIVVRMFLSAISMYCP